MKLRRMLITTTLAAASLAAVAAMAQSEPVTSDTGRFGDATSIARKYQDYLFGVIKEKHPDELILSKTKAGVDQAIKLTKKTKFTLDGKPSSFDTLKLGDDVYIDFNTDRKTGGLIAKKVVSGVDVPSIPSANP
jgi:hypothetical protein